MRRQAFTRGFCLVLLAFILLPLSSGEARKKKDLVGTESWHFSLPSTEDRLINYSDEYYGKYHLVLTFFPAAFTPI